MQLLNRIVVPRVPASQSACIQYSRGFIRSSAPVHLAPRNLAKCRASGDVEFVESISQEDVEKFEKIAASLVLKLPTVQNAEELEGRCDFSVQDTVVAGLWCSMIMAMQTALRQHRKHASKEKCRQHDWQFKAVNQPAHAHHMLHVAMLHVAILCHASDAGIHCTYAWVAVVRQWYYCSRRSNLAAICSHILFF